MGTTFQKNVSKKRSPHTHRQQDKNNYLQVSDVVSTTPGIITTDDSANTNSETLTEKLALNFKTKRQTMQDKERDATKQSVKQRLPLGCLSCLYFVVIFVLTYGGVLQSTAGREYLLKLEASTRVSLLITPPSERGTMWSLIEKLDAFAIQLPLFVVGYGGDRLAYYDGMHHTLGDISPFGAGVAIHKYKAVSDILKSMNQPRGHYLGARIVPDR